MRARGVEIREAHGLHKACATRVAHRTRKENTYMAHDETNSPPARGGGVNPCATPKWHMQNPGNRSGQGGTFVIQRTRELVCGLAGLR